MKRNLKTLFEEYKSLPNCSQRVRLSRDIRIIKNRLVRERDYVGIVHISQFLGRQAKDRLFNDLLDKSRESSIFVLAFGCSDDYSYKWAYEIAKNEYENDCEAIKEDIWLTMDDILSEFLRLHTTDEDIKYFQTITDGGF